MRHRRRTDGALFTTRGWYAQASLRPNGRWHTLRPYVVIDHLQSAIGEEYLADVPDQNIRATGLRWDVAKQLALNGEMRSHLTRKGTRDHELRLQLVFAF